MSQLSKVQTQARVISENLLKNCMSNEDSKQMNAWSRGYYTGLYDGGVIDKEELDRLTAEINCKK